MKRPNELDNVAERYALTRIEQDILERNPMVLSQIGGQ